MTRNEGFYFYFLLYIFIGKYQVYPQLPRTVNFHQNYFFISNIPLNYFDLSIIYIYIYNNIIQSALIKKNKLILF